MKQTAPLDLKEMRGADYSLLDAAKPFKPCKYPESSDGNIGFVVKDLDDKCYLVSAPYALARLCALFEGLKVNVFGQRAYKITWQCALRHKKSGVTITFYDYKGGLSVGSDAHENIPESLAQDLMNLMGVLCNDKCPHPYDGCVVGEIA